LRPKQACFGLEEEKTFSESFFNDRRSLVILQASGSAARQKLQDK